ncbi:MAG: response regulator [Bryobacteraceae bacterium]|nr:response regulator [Bryobacteraceae bacterium]
MERTALVLSSKPEHTAVLNNMLSNFEIRVASAPTISEARRRLARESFGVVLSEAVLEDGDWREVVRTVRDSHFGAQVLVTKKGADSHFFAEALEAGAYDVITQPFHQAEVQRLFLSAYLKYESVAHGLRKLADAAESPKLARAV